MSLCLFSLILSRIVCFSELESVSFPLTLFQIAEGLQPLALGHHGVTRRCVRVWQVPQPLLRLLAPQLLPLQQAAGKGEQVSAHLAGEVAQGHRQRLARPFKPSQVLCHWLRTPGTQVLAHTLMVGDTPCLNHKVNPGRDALRPTCAPWRQGLLLLISGSLSPQTICGSVAE